MKRKFAGDQLKKYFARPGRRLRPNEGDESSDVDDGDGGGDDGDDPDYELT